MTSEDMTIPKTDRTASDGASEAAKGVGRRAFLKGLGGTAAGVAVLSRIDLARADSNWDEGVLDDLSDDKLIRMQELMLRSRLWEDAMIQQFLSGEDGVYGVFHLSTGEEACAVGANSALREDDFITSTHRGHHDLIAKGGDLNKMSAEIYFKEGGYCKGFGGSMHITDVSLGILGMNGIIGPAHLLAAGAAYGIQIRGTDQVALANAGDGAVQNGYFWAALRNAALYKLPVVFFIQNNGWQVSNPVQNTISIRDLARIGDGLEIPGDVVDGQDVLAVYSVVKKAVDRARSGQGPSIVEAKTHRFYDHSGFAGAEAGRLGAFGLPYRSDKDVLAWIANDPIAKFRRQLIALGVLTEQSADELEEKVKQDVAASVEFARQSPLPQPDAGLEHVYAEGKVGASQFV